MLLRGAVFYIAMSLWGPFKVKSLKHSFGSVLPSLRQVSVCLSVSICVCVSVCLSVCLSVFVCVCIICMYIYICMYVCVCVCARAVCVSVCVCIFTVICKQLGHTVRPHHCGLRGLSIYCSACAQVWTQYITD